MYLQKNVSLYIYNLIISLPAAYQETRTTKGVFLSSNNFVVIFTLFLPRLYRYIHKEQAQFDNFSAIRENNDHLHNPEKTKKCLY